MNEESPSEVGIFEAWTGDWGPHLHCWTLGPGGGECCSGPSAARGVGAPPLLDLLTGTGSHRGFGVATA